MTRVEIPASRARAAAAKPCLPSSGLAGFRVLLIDILWTVRDRCCLLAGLARDGLRFARLLLRSRTALAAEVLFHQKQIAAFTERDQKPRRVDDASRITMVLASHLFRWRDALVIVKPKTLLGWHRRAFRLFWRWRSRPKPGRPPIPAELQSLIWRIVTENPGWEEERIANELSLKLGIKVSPRTVGTYWPIEIPRPRRGRHVSIQRWADFMRNHIRQIVACDFFTVSLWNFKTLYVFVLLELDSRRILHVNVTRHPTAAWTAQQFREAIPADHRYRFLIRDRDKIFSPDLDRTVKNMGLRVLKTPPQAPQANSFCERVIGTIRRECLDFLIPLTEAGLRGLLREWVGHYNRTRPHSAKGPGLPEAATGLPAPAQTQRHRLPSGYGVKATPILGGLHHDYRLDVPSAA
jgi:putative transposase